MNLVKQFYLNWFVLHFNKNAKPKLIWPIMSCCICSSAFKVASLTYHLFAYIMNTSGTGLITCIF